MEERKAQAAGPARWRIEHVKGSTLAFNCPACHAPHSFDALAFSAKPDQMIEGLTKTDQVVRRAMGQNVLALAVGVAIFIWVHRALFGPVIQVGPLLIVPSFAAVLAYNLAKFLFQGLPVFGKGIPIFRVTCRQCRTEALIASDGKSLALPEEGSANKAPIEAAGSQPAMAAPLSGDPAKSPEAAIVKAPEPKLPRLKVRRSAVKAMAGDRDVEQLVQVAQRGGLLAQLAAAKALLAVDDVAGLDALLNDTEFGRYYERAALQLESHRSEPRAVDALRRAAIHDPSGPGDMAIAMNKTRRRAAAKVLERLGQPS